MAIIDRNEIKNFARIALILKLIEGTGLAIRAGNKKQAKRWAKELKKELRALKRRRASK